MTPLVKLTIFASALVLAGLGASSFAAADRFARPCIVCSSGNGPRDIAIDQNQRTPGGRRRQIEKPEGPKGLDQGYPTQLRFRSQKQPGVSDNTPDPGYPTRRKFHREAQPYMGDDGPRQGMPEQNVRKYHPDDQPGVGSNGPDQGTLGRHIWKYHTDGRSRVGDNGPDQGTLDPHIRKYHPDDQPGVGDNGPDESTLGRYVRKYHPDDQPGVGDNGPDQGALDPHIRKYHADDRPGIGDNQPDQGMPDPYVRKYPPNDQIKQRSDADVTIDRKRKHYAQRRWQYDPHRHERRHHRDKRFRFYFGGFWYPVPYWDEFYGSYDDDYIASNGVSCREGAEIVAERFYRVRIIDCHGGVFTYRGSRYGETFEIELSALTGTILNAHEI